MSKLPAKITYDNDANDDWPSKRAILFGTGWTKIVHLVDRDTDDWYGGRAACDVWPGGGVEPYHRNTTVKVCKACRNVLEAAMAGS